jgi:uncharacterized OsmC-like protein
MNAEQLRARQKPLKDQYRDDPASAVKTLSAVGIVDFENVTCRVDSEFAGVPAGLHPATGGSGEWACSGDMLLESLVSCAGVTLAAVATAMEVPIRAASVRAEGELDFRGTLGVSRDAPIGFTEIRVSFNLDTDADAETVAKLIKLTERYCVVFQTLKSPPKIVLVSGES